MSKGKLGARDLFEKYRMRFNVNIEFVIFDVVSGDRESSHAYDCSSRR
jgi:hypothetical protein